MSSGRDLDPAAEASDDDPESAAFTDCEFVGPLRPADQAWSEHVLRADTSAALFEPADNVIRRREAHVSGLYRMASLLALSGDLTASGAAGFRAVAEARALAEFMAASPAYCLDCFLLGDRCQRHRVSGAAGTAAAGTVASGSAAPGATGGPGAGATGPGTTGPASPGSETEAESTGTASAGTGSTETGSGPGSPGPSNTGPGGTGPSNTGPGGTGPGDTGPGRTRSGGPSGHQPEWRRFGADEFPSASG